MNRDSHKSFWQFTRYLLVGGFNTFFGYGLFALLNWCFTGLGSYSYMYAAVLSNLIAITVAFLGYKWFVFRTRGNYLAEWIRCLGVYGSSMLIGLAGLPILVTILRHQLHRPELAPYIAAAIMMPVTVLFSFLGHKNISFRTNTCRKGDSKQERSKEKVLLMPTSLPVTGNTERTMPENRAFYPALDGLRAIAFFLVFFQHYYSIPWGWAGVNIFFVLSGFLITGILYDSRNDAHRSRNFYVRRTLRIFPLYYGVILVILLFDPVFHWHWSLAWLAWPLYFANFLRFFSPTVMIGGGPLQLAANAWLITPRIPGLTLFFGHFWSLCVEEQFYLFWPWFVFRIHSRRILIWICGIVVTLVPLLRVLAQHEAATWMLKGELLYRATPFQLDALLLGGMVALLVRGPHRKRIFEIGAIIAPCAIFLSVVFIAVGIVHSYPNWRFGYPYPAWKFTWGLTFIDFFAAGIIVCCLRPSGAVYRFLSLRVLRWVGRISYGAYIFHDIFHIVCWAIVTVIGSRFRFVANHAEEFVLLLGLICTLLISWLSFRYFESLFINLKERWTVSQH